MNQDRNQRRQRWAWGIGLTVAALGLCVSLSWPTPRFFTQGIPSSAQNIEKPAWRYSIPGDHLQLLYHFDLMRDMLAGRIEWFHNPYEFNTGSDAERYRPGAYFFPMSGVYAALAPWSAQAAAWNFTWMLSVWLSALFMWGWLRRFTRDPAALAMGIAIGLLLPFRWISLFGGSPSGMALLWVPLVAWGVDIAVRQATWTSGAWVGVALLMCFWGDLQVFYFLVLSLPALFFISLLTPREAYPRVPWRRWARVLPLGFLCLAVMLAYHLWRKGFLAESMMGEGRGWHEVRLFSPVRSSVFRPRGGLNDTMFIGYFAYASLWAALGLTAWKTWRGRFSERMKAGVFAVVAGGVAVTLALGLGANGPRQAWFLRQARDFIPYYDMIRQPFKIMALMPLWLGFLLALGWAGTARETAWTKRGRWALAVVLVGGMWMETNRWCSATVSLIRPEQGAYAAVQADAQRDGRKPARALVVPLWPGESAETSVPIFHAHHYRLRLVNGYSPVVSTDYFENIFRRLESVNQGWLTDEQSDFLLERGIRYLILHENQFPEKVSPFPVTLTRDRLLAHPRLDFLDQDGPVWAFRLRESAVADPRKERRVSERFPTRRWTFARQVPVEQRTPDTGAHGGAFLRLFPEDPKVVAGPWRIAPSEQLHWLLRVRGHGMVRIGTQWADTSLGATEVAIDAADWTWISVPLPRLPDFEQIRCALSVASGAVDADTGLLLLGTWAPLEAEETEWTWTAADFFHAGYSDGTSQHVYFRPSHDPDRTVQYGPKLPLPAGRYVAEWDMVVDAPPGTDAGELIMHDFVSDEQIRFPVRAGEPFRMEWEQPGSHVVNLIYIYRRTAKVSIRNVTLTRHSFHNSAVTGSP